MIVVSIDLTNVTVAATVPHVNSRRRQSAIRAIRAARASQDCARWEARVCRSTSGSCDVEETCDGKTSKCPADAHKQAGTPCEAMAKCAIWLAIVCFLLMLVAKKSTKRRLDALCMCAGERALKMFAAENCDAL